MSKASGRTVKKKPGGGKRKRTTRARTTRGLSRRAATTPPVGVSTQLPERDRAAHRQWLLEITQIPTASGREQRIVEWIRRWARARKDLTLREDGAGNIVIAASKKWGRAGSRPVYFTAHLDHPAFVVERVIGPGTVELAFRGGVMDAYFDQARVVLHTFAGGEDRTIGATLTGEGAGVASADGRERLFKTYLAELDHESDGAADGTVVRPGDVATWALPPAEIDPNGIVHTWACDDLAALAASLGAFDALRRAVAEYGRGAVQDVRLIFTRSEEIGFTGAIAACRLRTMPKNARVIALENSRSFADSPIGGGPIVRVGDRMSIFSPRLTAACAKRAEQIAAKPAADAQRSPTALEGGKWQRKLMAGGACEATVFCAYGYEATCLCLPLGNYHNMADLAELQAGTYDRARKGPPRVGREYIALSDFEGLVDLLTAIGLELPEVDPVVERIERLYQKHAFVLEERRAGQGGRKPRVRAR